MKREIVLHGALARFGGPFRLEVETAGEAVRALFQLAGFREALMEGEYRVIAGARDAAAEELALTLGATDRIEIIPVAAGGKQSGVGKIIAGAVLIAAAIVFAPAAAAGGAAAGGAAAGGAAATGMGATAFTMFGSAVTYGNIAMFGASLALGGIIQALTPMPGVSDFGQFESADQRPSFLFNGAVNTTEQGGPVPLIFGRARVGSRVISAGLTAERV